ncbi:MAG: winged helix-turn-helix domain-containing protein [Thermoprotei archaeon]|jgi:predicted transcriptional regulator
MKKYRCAHDIIASILTALVSNDKRITELCLHAEIPIDRGRIIIKHLLAYGLIITKNKNNVSYYSITETGYKWLGMYNSLRTLLPLMSDKK